ncbi:MAG: sigma-54-dependent transcriptional regulator [Planctomycetota bacterium]|jgi:two-component system response regulator HydG
MEDHANVLVTTEAPATTETIRRTLQEAGHACTVEPELAAGLEQARSGRYDVIVTGIGAGGADGMEVLRAARRADPNSQVIVVTPESRAEEAVAAMMEGALYYVQTPLNPVELVTFVERAAERVLLARDRASMQSELAQRYAFDNIVGNSPPMQKVFRKIAQIAPTDVTVLIQGETGTGKELVARAIHYGSARQHNRFVPLNCAGLVETILESELFGHAKGAFTGAARARVGLFEYANHGTLFLDEIGDMPLSSQTKVLRALEQGEIVRVGSNEPIHVDVRLIAATNQNLRDKMANNSFRRDLFYRLNVVTVNLPPLRERQSDVPLLIESFVREFSEAYDKPIAGLHPAVRKVLFRYPWPGNVRELRNCIEHMVVATIDDLLGEDDLPDYVLEETGQLLEEPSLASLAGQPLEEVEKRHIAGTLELVDGNREKAAELLGIGERTLYRKIEKYGLR